MASLRTITKHWVESAMVASGIPRRRIQRDPSGVAVLAYHNIVPHGQPTVGERSAHLSQAAFAEQLDTLAATHDFVSLEGALDGSTTDGTRPRVVVTFDDAYTGAVTAGFEELERRDIPATMFVPPGLLGSAGFWWDRITRPSRSTLDPVTRDFALARLEGRQDEILAWARKENLSIRDLPPHSRPASESLLTNAAKSARISLAPHTWRHPNLAAIPVAEAREEIATSARWVSQTALPESTWLAYPYGLASSAVEEVVDAELSGAVLVEGGAARRNGKRIGGTTRVPRMMVPRDLSLNGLILRVAGVIEG